MRIAIISGSIREGRRSTAVAQWIKQHADERGDAEYEVIEVADFDIPLLTSPTHPMAAKGDYGHEGVNRWGGTIGGFDGYVFVTPEYNHGVPGGFKNAVDSIGPEWVDKTVALVSYGSVGGLRAAEQWRQVLANFNMYVVRMQVDLSIFGDWSDDGFSPADRKVDDLGTVLDQLVTATQKLTA